MGQKSKNVFYLDPDYENFVPRKTRLKFETITSISATSAKSEGFRAVSTSILAIVLLTAIMFTLREEWTYRTQAVSTIATVISCARVNNNKSNTLRITYQYSVSGTAYTDIDSDYHQFRSCSSYPMGISLPIEYLPSKPSESRIVQSHLFLFCAAPFIIAGMIWYSHFSYTTLSSYMRTKKMYSDLKRNGVLLIGRIVEAVGFEEEWNAGIFRINYEFKTPDGRILKRTVQHYRDDFVGRQPPEKGTKVMVLYADDSAVMML